MYLFWLLVIIFSFLQTVVLQVDVVSALAMWALLVWQTRKAWISVMLAGVVADVVAGREVGWLSLGYLILGMGLWLYRRQYQPFNSLFLFLFVSGGILLVNGFLFGNFVWIQAVVFGLLAVSARTRLIDQSLGRGSLKVYN